MIILNSKAIFVMWGRERQSWEPGWFQRRAELYQGRWTFPLSGAWDFLCNCCYIFWWSQLWENVFYYPLKEETHRWYLHTRTCSFPEEFRLIRVGSSVLNTVLLFNLLTWNLLFQNQQHLHKSCNRQLLLKIMQHRPACQLKVRTVDCCAFILFF